MSSSEFDMSNQPMGFATLLNILSSWDFIQVLRSQILSRVQPQALDLFCFVLMGCYISVLNLQTELGDQVVYIEIV